MKIVNKSYQETESKDLAKAKKELAPLGLEVTFDKETKEYRVNFKGGKEGTAYYANDVDDAIGTGKAMAKEGDKSKKKESKKKEDDDQDDNKEKEDPDDNDDDDNDEEDDEEDKKDDKEEGKKKKKENLEPSYEDVVLESEVRINQDDHVLVLEKGDKIRVLKEKKLDEAKYPQDWNDHEMMAEHLAEAIDRFGGPMECHYYPDSDYGGVSFEITYNRKRFALDLYLVR